MFIVSRFTVKNHELHPAQKPTYRIPIERFGNFEIKTTGFFTAMFGDMADRLGQYEDLGSVEELQKLARTKK